MMKYLQNLPKMSFIREEYTPVIYILNPIKQCVKFISKVSRKMCEITVFLLSKMELSAFPFCNILKVTE